MTPDTIITAELLAGLQTCPFCGAESWYKSQSQIRFRCRTGFMIGSTAAPSPLSECECKYLRARVKELEEALNQITNQDYRGNRSVESQIAYAALKKGTQ